MIRAAAFLVLVSTAAQAGEAPLWEGYWSANASWCSRAGDVGDEVPNYYGPDGLFGMEWSCDVSKVSETGSVSYTHLTLPTIYSV